MKRNFYRSGYEATVADDLRARGVAFEFEAETWDYVSAVRGGVCLDCDGKHIGKRRKYTPDFIVPRNGRERLIIEAKGRFPSTDRSKMRDVKKMYPDRDIRMLFQQQSKAEQAKLAAWCNKFGFPFAFGNAVPEEWL